MTRCGWTWLSVEVASMKYLEYKYLMTCPIPFLSILPIAVHKLELSSSISIP